MLLKGLILGCIEGLTVGDKGTGGEGRQAEWFGLCQVANHI